MTHPVAVVFRKELLDGRRDRRAVFSAFLFPVLGPVFVYFMMTAIVTMQSEAQEKRIPVVGLEHAPAMVQWLEERGIVFEPFEGDDPETAVQDRDVELVLVIPENFQRRYGQGRPASVQIVQDRSRTDSGATINRLERRLRQYGNELASLRLIARGTSPEIINGVVIDTIDVASEQERAAAALNFIPMYIMLAAFVAGMGIAVDATAGERERKSLEPLLINPVERYQLVAGKWLAASVFAGLGMALTAVLCIVAMRQVPLENIGLTFSVSPLQVAAIVVGTTPLALLVTSLQLLLGMFAKSFKDAQSYMGILVILPVVPTLFTMFNPVATQDWMFAIPVLGQQLMLVDMIGGKSIPIIAYFYSAGSCLVAALALVFVTARFFERESVVTS